MVEVTPVASAPTPLQYSITSASRGLYTNGYIDVQNIGSAKPDPPRFTWQGRVYRVANLTINRTTAYRYWIATVITADDSDCDSVQAIATSLGKLKTRVPGFGELSMADNGSHTNKTFSYASGLLPSGQNPPTFSSGTTYEIHIEAMPEVGGTSR